MSASVEFRSSSPRLWSFRSGGRRPTAACMTFLRTIWCQPEVLRFDPGSLAVLKRTTQGQSSQLEIVTSFFLGQFLDDVGESVALVQECREDRDDCPQEHDAVANLHVVTGREAPSQSPSERVVPVAHLTAEILVVQEFFRSTSSGINALSEAMQLSLAAKCLLFVDFLLGMPASKEFEDLVQETSKVLGFSRSAL